jgi:hypothetical protein
VPNVPGGCAVLTLVDFVAALIVSWVVGYPIYGLTLLAVRSVWRMVRAVARLGESALIQSSPADSVVVPAVLSTVGNHGDVPTPAMQRPTSWEEFDALQLAYALWVVRSHQVSISLREMKGTVAATQKIIGQSRVLIAKADAILARR